MNTRRYHPLLMVTLCAAAACGGTDPLSTGLSGTVRRGPTAPVCVPGDNCDAPFSAGFTVRSGAHVVARFTSAADGSFTVRVAPGSYSVVPDANAPILDPANQVKQVTVARGGFTTVQLDFDTGIR